MMINSLDVGSKLFSCV